MFFFKRKKLHIDAFVTEKQAHAYNYAKIDYSNKFLPDWWKNLPKSDFSFEVMDIRTTMKSCMGFVNHFQQGIMLPMWSDLAVKIRPDNMIEYKFSDSASQCSFHSPEQRMGFYMNHINMKIESPWLLKTNEEVMFNYLPAFWNSTEDDPYRVVPATVDFYYQSGLAINMLMPNRPKEFIVPFGKPMVHLIPLSERETDLKIHLVSDKEWHVLGSSMTPITFTKKYSKIKKIIKDRGCPVKFEERK